MEKWANKLTIYQSTAGCDVYYTNDAYRNYFPERYLLNNNDEPLYFNTIKEAAEYVSGIVNQKVDANMTAIEQALDEYEEARDDDDVYFSFHQIQVVDD